MNRESLNECSVFFLWTKARLVNRPSRNSTLFPSRRRAKKVLFGNSTGAAKFLKTFQVHFLFYDQENWGKGNLGILFVINFAIFARQYFAKLYFRDIDGGIR